MVISLIRLEKALDFYERNVEGINLDGLGGVRMAQGIFLELSEMSLSKKLEYKLKAVINMFKERLTKLAEKTMGPVKNQAPNYYIKFKKLVESPFMFDRKLKVKNHLNKNRTSLKKS